MRRERLYLPASPEATGHMADFIFGADAEEFAKSELLRRAVVQKLATIAEAAGRVSGYSAIPRCHGCRSRISKYSGACVLGIEWDVVWRAAANRCPLLRDQIAEILVMADDTDDRTAELLE
jgi:uncharacterized protein with HEPN domain